MPARETAGEEVAVQSGPPDSNDDAVEGDHPCEQDGSAEREVLVEVWDLPRDQRVAQEASEARAEGADGEEGYGDGDPEVPDDDVQSGLEWEEGLA